MIDLKEKMKLVELVNKIAVESEINGADLGGTYAQNMECMKNALDKFARFLEIKDYKIETIVVAAEDQKQFDGRWHIQQIIVNDYGME